MSKSPIKRMQTAPLYSYKRTFVSASVPREEWNATGGRRWSRHGTVTLPCGLTVDVSAGGSVDDKSDGMTSLCCTFNGRAYSYYDQTIGIDSVVSLRRLAVAFAERVRNAAKPKGGAK